MEIVDFLPKYPDIVQSKYPVLNPYEDENFYNTIYHKKEFYENKLGRTEEFPRERGMATKYQKTIARYLSSKTPYDEAILVHSPGLGKTCSAIGAIEQIISEESSSERPTFTGAIILAKGSQLLDNFTRELVEKCTSGQYIPENYKKLTDREKTIRTKKKIKFYQLHTFAKFAKRLKKMTDEAIAENFSNKIIVIDEVHNLRIQKNEKDSVETYQQFHRFLHLISNRKIMLLSGTPMKDGPEELASVCNLILPLQNQFPTGDDFLEQYMTEKNGIHSIRPEKIPEIKQKLKGKISFLREAESSVQKKFIGKKNYRGLKEFIVAPGKMSSFQSKHYASAYLSDKSGKQGVYINSREASLFVYPDGSYGTEGFGKYILTVTDHKSKTLQKLKKDKKGEKTSSTSSFRMSEELKKALKGSTREKTLENIRRHSSTYANIIENILETKGNCFVYSSLVKGSGAILFSLLLELVGFSKANGKETEPGMRYAILTTKTSSSGDIKRINSRFNEKDNMHGEIIKVIIGSGAVREGFSFKNVLFEAIATPHWNYSETAQALARGIRLGSHNDLIQEGITPEVKILQPVAVPGTMSQGGGDDLISIDLLMYRTSEDKDISIRAILRLLMEISFDCALNYIQNHVENGIDGSRECDYTTCNYQCEGIPEDELIGEIPDAMLDYSTYQLYYSEGKISQIRQKVEALFRQSHKLDLDSVISNLKGQYTEEDIENALVILQDEVENSGRKFDYKTFLDIYSVSPVKKISNGIEELFRENFRLSLDSILEIFTDYTQFEVLTALRSLINNSVILKNKYGLPCYLREENNVYFLVNNISVSSDFYVEYYTKYPHIQAGRDFNQILNRMYNISLPSIIRRLCSTQNQKEFTKLMKSLPIPVQEMFIEASLVARDQKVGNEDIQKKVIEFFNSYIKKVDNTWISTFSKSLRCLNEGENLDGWHDCEKEYSKKLVQSEEKRKEKLREENPYGILGKYNPENGAFCLLDFSQEGKNKSRGKSDQRIMLTGKVCSAGGWKLPQLLDIVVNRLSIPPPDNRFKGESEESLRDKLKSDKTAMKYFSESEVKNAKKDTLARMLYWGSTKKNGGIRGMKPICEELRKWLEKNNLVEIDNQCGVQGKKKIMDKEEKKEKKKTSRNFRVEAIIPGKNPEKFSSYTKDVAKLMDECFAVKKFKTPIDNNTWILILSRKKLVGVLSVDENNYLSNVCVAKNYRRQGISVEAMKTATDYICEKKGKSPTLRVDNRNKDIKKLIKMYTGFGFETEKTDELYTYMKHSCKK